jgi:hypothetical protein
MRPGTIWCASCRLCLASGPWCGNGAGLDRPARSGRNGSDRKRRPEPPAGSSQTARCGGAIAALKVRNASHGLSRMRAVLRLKTLELNAGRLLSPELSLLPKCGEATVLRILSFKRLQLSFRERIRNRTTILARCMHFASHFLIQFIALEQYGNGVSVIRKLFALPARQDPFTRGTRKCMLYFNIKPHR